MNRLGGVENSGPLTQAVAKICIDLRPQLSTESVARLDDVIRRLEGPLQLAVAGRIKSGKSTVVNALIGKRVAPTDVRECTRLVTRFQYGTVDRVDVVGIDGSRRSLPYDSDGLIPTELTADISQIAYLDAFLTSASLHSVTVIDTPGLSSLDRANARRTEIVLGAGGGAPVSAETLAEKPENPSLDSSHAELPSSEPVDGGSRAAVAQAEAVLFVLTQAARADDVDVLSGFHASSSPLMTSPINALGVLNKADHIAADNPIQRARELAASHAEALRHQLSDVLPLVGVVAETTETGEFREVDADLLRQVVAIPKDQRDILFYSTDLFMRNDLPVSVPGRLRLLERLDLFSIRYAVDQLERDPTISTGHLRQQLAAMSGFPALRGIVDHTFRRRADGIKASVALAALQMVANRATDPKDRSYIRDSVEVLLARPEAHQLRLLEAASLVTSGTVSLPPDMTADVLRLIGSDNPSEQLGSPHGDLATLRNIALDKAAQWRSYATFGSAPAQSRVAHVVHRGFFLLWQRLNTWGAY